MGTRRLPGNERRTTTFLRSGVLAGACAVALVAGAGDVYTLSAGGNWSAAANWSGAMPTAGGAADATIVFNGTGDIASTNDLSGTFLLNRLESAAGTVTLWGNTLSFVDSGAAGPQVVQAGEGSATFRSTLSLAADTAFNVANGALTVGPVSGSGGLVKTGAGEMLCATNGNGALSFTGATRVENGTLTIGTSSARSAMSSSSLTVKNGATLRILWDWKAHGLFLPDSASIHVESGGTILSDVPTISCGTFNAVSGATVAGGNGCLSLHAVDSGDTAVSTLGSLSLTRIILEPYGGANPTQTLRFDGTGPGLSIGTDSGRAFSLRPGSSSGHFTFVMDIADSPAAPIDLLVPFMNFRPGSTVSKYEFVKRGTGVMQVNGLDWSGASAPTRSVDGVVEVGTLIWNTSATNAAGVNFTTVTVGNDATLQVGAGGTTGAIFVDPIINGTLAFNRSNTYLFNRTVSGTGRLVQKGSGALALNGTHTYSGGTAVESGTLMVVAPGVLSGSGTVTVTGGTLGGDGTINGPVAVSGDGALAPGDNNTIGTLTLANTGADALTLSGACLFCDLAPVAGSCDRIDVAGTLILNGTNQLALAFTEGMPPAGTYTLLTYAARSGTGTLVFDRPYPNATLTVGATATTLTVASPGITYLTWTGAVSGIWDTTTVNWTLLGAPSTYTAGDAVLFNDDAALFTISAASAVEPSSVTFDNSIKDYTISAILAGAETTVFKTGAKSVTLSGANTYGGGTILAGGTLTVGSVANLPFGPLAFRGGTLKFTGTSPTTLDAYAVNWDSFNGGLDLPSGTLTIANTISGGGSLSLYGNGTLVLSGANSYRGGTMLARGSVLRVNHSHALGAGAVVMAVANGEVDLTGNLTITNAISIRGVGATASGEGAIRSVNGTTNTWNGPITIAENQARIGCTGGGMLKVGGVIDSGSSSYEFVVRMPNDVGGTLLLSANNTWLGNTWLRCGTIKLGIDNALPPDSVLRLGLGASQTGVTDSTLDLAGFSQIVAGVQDVGTENRHCVTNTEEPPSTLTINNTSAYTFAGEFSGNLDIVKTSSGTLTLSGASSTSGGLIVSNGTVVISASGSLGPNCTNITVAAGTLTLQSSMALDDEAVLRIANGGGAKINLAAGVNETVGYLYFGDKLCRGGTYGATGSGALTLDDEHFAGSGILRVRHGTGGTLIRLK